MRFFKNEYEPTIINENITKGNLQKWCDTNGVDIKIHGNSTYWAGFSMFYALHRNMSYIEASSFAYMVSMFMTGTGVSDGTEAYFREANIEFALIGKLEELKMNINDEEKVAVKFFEEIYRLYKDDIEKYTYKIHMLSFRLSQSDFDMFNSVNGRSKVEKLRVLMNHYFER